MDRALLVAALLALLAAVVVVLRRPRRTAAPRRVDPAQLGLPAEGIGVVVFSSPRCHACELWRQGLAGVGVPVATVDIARRPDLAGTYRVSETPLVLAARARDGQVVEAYGGDPDGARIRRLAELTGTATG